MLGVRFLPASDQSLMVYFGEEISLGAHECVVKFLRLLEREPISVVRNVHPGYCSVLVKFDALACTHAELEALLRGYVTRLEVVKIEKARLVEIPVCYGGEFGPDFEDVCELHGLTAGEVIERHSAVEYLVYFLGFVPGFAYLGRDEDRECGKSRRAQRQAPCATGDSCYAAVGGAASSGARGKCGDCRGADWGVSLCYAWWVAVDRADSDEDVFCGE